MMLSTASGVIVRALIADRLDQGELGGVRRERADLGEVEEPLGVRLRSPHPAAQLRQAGADQDDRQLSLGGSMERGDERGQLFLFHVLELIDEDGQGRVRRLGRVAGRLQERLEVVFKVAVVGKSGLRVEVQADLDVLVLDLERLARTRPARGAPGLPAPSPAPHATAAAGLGAARVPAAPAVTGLQVPRSGACGCRRPPRRRASGPGARSCRRRGGQPSACSSRRGPRGRVRA